MGSRQSRHSGGHDAHAHHQRHGRQRRWLDAGRRAHRRRDDRGRGVGARGWRRPRGPGVDRTIDAAGQLRHPGRASTCTPTWSCPSAARSPRTRSRRARAPRPSAARPRSSTSPSSRRASRLREGLDAWHAKAEGNCAIDYGFHMIMTDVNDDTLAEMDELVAEGITDFKLFTAYPGVFYTDDGAIFRAMQRTAKNGGTILMHAENGMAIDVVAARGGGRGQDRPLLPRRGALPDLRGRGHQPRHPPRRGRRRAGLHRPSLGPRRARGAARGPRPRRHGLRRDVPAVPVPLARRHGQRLRGRQVHLLAAAAPGRPSGRALDGPRQGRPAGRLDRPLPLRLPRPEGARVGATSARCPTGCPASRIGST